MPRRFLCFLIINSPIARTAARPKRPHATPMPACAPVLRVVPPLITDTSSGWGLLVLGEVFEVVDEVMDVSLSEVVDDCGAVLTGDHDARAMAEKVSDGEEPLHPASPQHSQTSVLEFHWIHVAPSLAGRHALVNSILLLRDGRLLTAGGTTDRIAICAVCAATDIVFDVLQTNRILAAL